MKKLAIIFFVIFSLFALVACSDNGDNTEEEKFKVMVTADEGVTVKSENPIYVKSGEDAIFEIEIDSTSVISSLEGGTVDGNTLTVSNVTRDTVVRITTENLGYDTTAKFKYYFEGAEGDTSDHKSGFFYNAGTEITISAKNKTDRFLGWSLKTNSADDADMISKDRVFKFRISPELADANGVIKIFANYADASFYYYDANGGSINTDTALTADCEYYTVSTEGDRLKITTSSSYREVYEAVHLFYADGTFTRPGYVLKEYNTSSDGTGEGYSLGSMYYPDPDAEEPHIIYCIWEEETPASDFTYEDVHYSLPDGVTYAKAPHWNTDGVKITGYSGDAEKIVIPETIDGKAVTAIGSGAFVNKSVSELVLSKNLLRIDDGAFVGCSSLNTVYYPDSIFVISNDVFDEATYTNFKNLYVNATMAPRNTGGYSVKLSRLMAGEGEKKIIVIAGSSTYQGFASEYMEALLDGEYRVVNFGTTRTTQGTIYLEAMKHFATADDIILYAPENSSYMLGESELYWKTLNDLEGMNNFFRYIDISNYTNVFSAFADYNKNHRYKNNPSRYERGYNTITKENSNINKYGENQNSLRASLVDNYVDVYYITLNERIKSKYEGQWNEVDNQIANKDYNDPNNNTWQSMSDPELTKLLNHAIDSAKSSGAKVCFSFCPMDADKVVSEAKNIERTKAYDELIKSIYNFDCVLGSSADYIFAHEYFYDCAFHPNDIGRTYRTYRVYLDICDLLGYEPNGYDSKGTDFEGCIFEDGSDGTPLTEVDYLK